MEQEDKHGMLYKTEGNLNEVISHFYHIYNKVGGPVMKHLSPSLEMLLVFNFGTTIPISFNNSSSVFELRQGCAVVGPLRQMLNYELGSGADVIVVNFRLSGFYRLFQLPLNNFNGETVYDPDKLTNRFSWQELWIMLSNITDLKARLNLISSYVMHYINDPEDAVRPLINGEHYFMDPLTQPVKAIASDASLTQRTIQLRFQKYAGYSSKELLRYLRFKMVVGYMLKMDEQSFDIFDIVTTFDYHDQSHVIKDFQHFLGTTPRQFLKNLKGKEFFLIGSQPENQDKIGE